MKGNITLYVKQIAELLGCPFFSESEEIEEVAEKISEAMYFR